MPAELSLHERDRAGEPLAWPEGVFAMLHELWGDAIEGQPYTLTQKLKWARLVESLEQQAVRTGHRVPSPTVYPARLTRPK